MTRTLGIGGILLALLCLNPALASAQATPARQSVVAEGDMVQLDFNDVELSVVIDTIARLTGKNFIYDDRVRGRVTIVSPTKITVDQAYAVFESVLQVKGFTTVQGPGSAIKVIPIRDAKESNIETLEGRRAPPDSDRYITRLIPLRFIDAEAIANTLKPLVSKDASMVAYGPTNTVILTDAATNIQRLLTILESIDVETYKEQLAVLKIRHADAATMAEQLSQIFDAEVSSTTAPSSRRSLARRAAQAAAAATPIDAGAPKGAVRILTDDRTNSLIVLTSRQRLDEIRDVVAKLDVPVQGGGRIHVYYLKHADAEELANTLNALVSGTPSAPSGGGAAGGGRSPQAAATQALRAAVTELAEGVSVTSDAPTNSLIIQASQEGFSTLSQVIEKLDIPRPQVLVEALIMEVDVTDTEALGFSGILTLTPGNDTITIGSFTSLGNLSNPNTNLSAITTALGSFFGLGDISAGSAVIKALVRASATDSRINIVSAPHILTSDNEEAEIKVGDNIPIITSRTESASTDIAVANPATSVNVERQDIGVTLRVTPQISEGDMVRLEIFQEISNINETLSQGSAAGGVGNPEDVGVALSNRKVENTVVVGDGETVVIGGLLSDRFVDDVTKIPFLGDIPILGWLFKSTARSLTKVNLLVFLTPNITRTVAELEEETIQKREEFWSRSLESLSLNEREQEDADRRRAEAEAAGIPTTPYAGRNPVRGRLLAHSQRYPVQRMLEIEREEQEAETRATEEAQALEHAPSYGVLAAVFRDEDAATALLTELVDAGYDGTLVSSETNGSLLLELRLGPYPSIEAAESAAETLRRGYSLSPTVYVDRPEP